MKKKRVYLGKKPGVPKGTTFPDQWITGPDPIRHAKYRVWLQQRNQAQWRGETWDLPFDDWIEVWGDRWEQRGTRVGEYCMTREDPEQPWSVDNVEVIDRKEHFQRHRARMNDRIQLARRIK